MKLELGEMSDFRTLGKDNFGKISIPMILNMARVFLLTS